MPRRSAITREDIASLDTLAAAFWRAARPHRDRAEVLRCAADVDRGGSWNDNARNVRAANRNANPRDDRDDNLGFQLAGAQTQTRTTCNRFAPDQTAVASGGSGCRRTPQEPRRARSGSGCAVERSPGLRLSGSRMERP
jgi:hypothetical protein